MDDLTKWLYQFVSERRMGSVHTDPVYKEASRVVDMQTEKLEETLSQEQKRELNRLLDNITALSCIEDEHLFRAALGLARELSRTVGAA